jgi:N-hydroxyarylamine O-acetyltransferase
MCATRGGLLSVDKYLDRIGLERVPRADLETLTAIHRAHLLAIPYENLDVQLGRPVGLDHAQIFGKIVNGGRGGWCYEMNGLFGWALDQLGFRVTRCAGAVMRERSGEASIGNHLVLKVELDEGVYLADVGFGDGPIDPVRITPGEFHSHGFAYMLAQADTDWWRLHNHPFGGAASFDFRLHAADESVLAERCRYLQTAPTSSFVQTLVVQRYTSAGLTTLRGRVLRRTTPTGHTERLLQNAGEFDRALQSEFGLEIPEAAQLWARVATRHEEFLRGH